MHVCARPAFAAVSCGRRGADAALLDVVMALGAVERDEGGGFRTLLPLRPWRYGHGGGAMLYTSDMLGCRLWCSNCCKLATVGCVDDEVVAQQLIIADRCWPAELGVEEVMDGGGGGCAQQALPAIG